MALNLEKQLLFVSGFICLDYSSSLSLLLFFQYGAYHSNPVRAAIDPEYNPRSSG